MNRIRLRLPKMDFFSKYGHDGRLFIWEGMFNNSAGGLSTGVYLTGMMVMLGASDFMVGLASSASTWALMFCVLAPLVIDRVPRQKPLLLASLLGFRLLTCLPVFLLAIMGEGMHTAVVALCMVILGNLLVSIFNTGYSMYFMDNIPKKDSAHFIYQRMFWVRLSFTVLSLSMSLLLDAMNKSYGGFLIVFSVAMACGLGAVISVQSLQADDKRKPNTKGKAGFFDPLKNRKYLKYLIFLFTYFFMFTMATSFTALYQIKYLELSYAFLAVFSLIFNIFMMGSTSIWRRLENRHGILWVFMLSAIMMAADFFIYTFLTKATLFLIVLSPLMAGSGNGGFWACMLPYRYSIMPKEGKITYEGWNGFIFGLAGLLGALAGGKLLLILKPIELPFFTFSVFQLIYLIAGIGALSTCLWFYRSAADKKPEKTL